MNMSVVSSIAEAIFWMCFNGGDSIAALCIFCKKAGSDIVTCFTMQIFPQFQRKIYDFGLQIYEILSSK
jgi:hypothetical protein